jgi:hypothetical protein
VTAHAFPTSGRSNLGAPRHDHGRRADLAFRRNIREPALPERHTISAISLAPRLKGLGSQSTLRSGLCARKINSSCPPGLNTRRTSRRSCNGSFQNWSYGGPRQNRNTHHATAARTHRPASNPLRRARQAACCVCARSSASAVTDRRPRHNDGSRHRSGNGQADRFQTRFPGRHRREVSVGRTGRPFGSCQRSHRSPRVGASVAESSLQSRCSRDRTLVKSVTIGAVSMPPRACPCPLLLPLELGDRFCGAVLRD